MRGLKGPRIQELVFRFIVVATLTLGQNIRGACDSVGGVLGNVDEQASEARKRTRSAQDLQPRLSI